MMDVQPYILIGGNSTRFGRDKATFEFKGETLAVRAMRVAESVFAGPKATFVSKSGGTFMERRMIGDVVADCGPAGAIHSALSDSSADWIFVLACDLPMVTDEFVELLARFAGGDRGCIVPVQPDGRWQPLCALYRVASCRNAFEDAIAIDVRYPSLREIIEPLEPRVVQFAEYEFLPDSRRLLTNMNTVADPEASNFV